jgi:hypothetical protein
VKYVTDNLMSDCQPDGIELGGSYKSKLIGKVHKHAGFADISLHGTRV